MRRRLARNLEHTYVIGSLAIGIIVAVAALAGMVTIGRDRSAGDGTGSTIERRLPWGIASQEEAAEALGHLRSGIQLGSFEALLGQPLIRHRGPNADEYLWFSDLYAVQALVDPGSEQVVFFAVVSRSADFHPHLEAGAFPVELGVTRLSELPFPTGDIGLAHGATFTYYYETWGGGAVARYLSTFAGITTVGCHDSTLNDLVAAAGPFAEFGQSPAEKPWPATSDRDELALTDARARAVVNLYGVGGPALSLDAFAGFQVGPSLADRLALEPWKDGC